MVKEMKNPQRAENDDELYSEQYQKYIAACAKHCRCEFDSPCDGVLAGGVCDRQKDHRDTLEDERADWRDDEE